MEYALPQKVQLKSGLKIYISIRVYSSCRCLLNKASTAQIQKMTSQKAGTLFNPELVTEIMTKVQGYSVLAKLSSQSAIPFNGTEQFIFNLEGNAQIVGEGEQKKAGESNLTSKVIKPMKFIYQARITDEFKYASEEKKIKYLQAYADGFAKKIAVAFDIAAIHGLEPKSMTDASFRDTNSFDGVITDNVVVLMQARSMKT